MAVCYIQKVVSKKNNKTYYLLVCECSNQRVFSKFIKYTEISYYNSLGIELI